MTLKFPLTDLSCVKGVLIDLDDTLYDFSKANDYALRQVHKYFKKYMDFDSFIRLYSSLLKKNVENARPSDHSRFLVFKQILEDKNVPYAWDLAEKAETAFWNDFIRRIRPEKEAIAFLKQAKENNLPVCLVSDMFGNIQARKLRKLKVQKYIDFMVTNDETNCDKPNPNIFFKALEKLQLRPEQTVMLGDNLKKDVEGAQAVGIKAYLVKKE